MDIANKLIEFETLGKQAKLALSNGWNETASLLYPKMAQIVRELKPVEDKVLFAKPQYAGLFYALECFYPEQPALYREYLEDCEDLFPMSECEFFSRLEMEREYLVQL